VQVPFQQSIAPQTLQRLIARSHGKTLPLSKSRRVMGFVGLIAPFAIYAIALSSWTTTETAAFKSDLAAA